MHYFSPFSALFPSPAPNVRELIILLDGLDCYGQSAIRMDPDTRIRGQLYFFSLPLPIYRRKRAQDIRIGDSLNGVRVIGVQTLR